MPDLPEHLRVMEQRVPEYEQGRAVQPWPDEMDEAFFWELQYALNTTRVQG